MYSDIVIVASGATVDKIYSLHGQEFLSKIRVVHMGVEDLILMAQKPKERVLALKKKFAGDGYLILNLNRIDPHKGIEYAIDALNYVEADKDVTLVVAGKYEERNRSYLEKLEAKKKAVETNNKKVIILRNISDDLKICLYDMADAFIMASPTEPFGITILESLARGTPVIVPDVEGPREIFGIKEELEKDMIDVWGGIMVRYGDPKKRAKNLGHAITKMIREQQKYKEIAKRAKEKVKELFSWETIARIHESLYRE